MTTSIALQNPVQSRCKIQCSMEPQVHAPIRKICLKALARAMLCLTVPMRAKWCKAVECPL
jgi:hypothetical protein